MSEAAPSILLTIEGHLAILTFNRPQTLNLIDMEWARAFHAALERIEDHGNIRAVAIAAEGRAFCAGGDVASFTAGERPPAEILQELAGALHDCLRRMNGLRVPTIAIVQGTAAGAGFSLILGCDFVVAADNARFTMAYAKLGATADGGATWLLPRLVGRRKALEILMLADLMDAQEALRLGLVTRLAPAETLREEGLALARKLAAGPSLAYGRIRALVDAAHHTGFDAQLDAERDAFAAVAAGPDFAEGVAAFLGKRKPVFNGA